MTLATAAALALFAQIGLVTHLFSLLVPILGTAAAGATMGAATGCAILGRTLLGMVLGPTADRRLVAAANVTVQAVGSIMLLSAGSSLPMVLLGCALFGLGLGNVTSPPPLIAQTEFRPADVARVVALVTAISQAGYAFAPAAFGLLRSLSGTMGFGSSPDSAPLLFVAAAIIQLAAAAAALLGRRPAPHGKAALIA
jgi:MFS family permease